jgi:hypothetical protein
LTRNRSPFDQEPFAVRVELAVQLDDLAADREHPGDEVKVSDPELGQLAPAEPAFDGCLDQELGICVGQGVVDRAELLWGDDRPRRGRDRGDSHSTGWM